MFAIMGAAPALAQNTQTRGIDNTQQELRARIQQGVASGHISQQEEQALYQRERDIQFREIRMKQDGTATAEERQALRRDLDNMRAEVEAKMANREVRGQQQSATPAIDDAMQQLHARIQQGITSGDLSRRESNQLIAKENKIIRLEARYKEDGRVTPQERKTLRSQIAMLSREVERKMANRETR
ncbi:hypothetical protein [Lacisediminimonas sp.]|uniref:hypothetical protein n=1 Tax=Lacisediminimonas sp. TaxID=3060582 RepID=UPI0027243AF4|nr:hypothetical protein [Lacisediminimonas sp.]MDO8298472.1 hypothetical protein [Lacisediminimonas sp.]